MKKKPAETVKDLLTAISEDGQEQRQGEEVSGARFFETNHYRCLVYREKQTDEIYLTLCGIEQCLPGYRFNAGERAGYHLHTILGGKGILSVNGVETELKEGQLFVTKPGEETWYRADEKDPWEYCWMAFDGNLAEKYIKSAGFDAGTNSRPCLRDCRRFGDLVKKALSRPEMNLANDIHRLAVLLEYISFAIEDYQFSTQRGRQSKVDYTDGYVEYAVNFIQANSATAKVSDVAHNIGIHRSYLTSIFRKKLGLSPQEYLMRVKLEKARRLLLDSEASIQEVSQMVGYENPLTFSKCFKNRYGVSPRAFRTEHIMSNL